MSKYWDSKALDARHIARLGTIVALIVYAFFLGSGVAGAQEAPAEVATVGNAQVPSAERVSPEEGEPNSTDSEKPAASAESSPNQQKEADVQRLRDELEATKSAKNAAAEDAKQAKLVAQILGEQIATPGFPKSVRLSILRRSAAAQIVKAMALSRQASLGEGLELQQTQLEELLAESAEERQAREQANEQDSERRRLEVEATQAEEKAVQAVAQAREMESHERDETLRELLARQRKAAEETLALTRSHRETMESIRATTQSRSEAFAARKGDLLARIDAFSDAPTPEERRENVDPLFKELVQGRGDARQRFAEILAERESAEEALEQAQTRFDEAEYKLERVEATKDEEVISDIYKRRVEAAQAEFTVAEKALAASREVFKQLQKQYGESERRLAFYGKEIPSLLPKISNDARGEFFKLSDRNIAYALAGVQEGIHHILRDVDTQLVKPSELNLLSIDLWRWVWGLLWRTLLVLVLIRVLMPRVSAQVARGTDALLKRRFFREHVSTTVRLSDALDALASPLLYFLGARFLANYIIPDELIAGFSTLIILRWALNAFFLYWMLVSLAQVFALPRWYRRKKQNLKTRLDLLFMEVAPPLDPANDPHLKRGKKLVRSVRVILLFWLVSKYVPDAARLVIGVSVFTWVIDFAARISLFIIVYWVLSTWKDNIAAFFERLAGDRMPRAVEVVNTRKDAFYGVFIIAVASVYVLGSELMRVARKYLLNTAWFRQASTLIFRAKIELRNREEESVDEAAIADAVPKNYVQALSADGEMSQFGKGLAGDGELIAGSDEFEAMTAIFDGWLNEDLRGSVVIVGEPGSGKSTVLRKFKHYIETNKTPSSDAPPLDSEKASVEQNTPRKTASVMWFDVHQRISTEAAVLEFVAGLFGLEPSSGATEATLLKRIKSLEPRVILLNNCHGLFLRRIGGFDGLQALFNIISLSDQVHFYALSFNLFAWSYVNRVRAQSHFFADVIRLDPWTDTQLKELVETRTKNTDYQIDFSHLLKSRDPDADLYNEAALDKTARGYFRYLQEFSGGNPRIAITYWLRSLRLEDAKGAKNQSKTDKTLQVSLFRRPSTASFAKQTDAHWFVLSAIAQHGHLSAAEIAQAVHLEEGFCDVALRFFAEADVVRIDAKTGQASLTPLYYRQVLKYLAQSNFLYE